jgi:TfoX/Sxy family transcriptional regulator of competence genes
MQVPKPSDEDRVLFRSVVPEAPGVVVKPMFGNLGAFVNGNMFAGLFGSLIGVRMLDEDVKRELEAIEGTGSYGPSERPMRGWVGLPAEWAAEPDLISSWVATAMAQVAQLPAKIAKAKH